jgi:hypothetical protein
VERDHYYNGLDWNELSHDDRCRLIFMIEAAAYCESNQVEDMKRAHHKELCDQTLNKVTNGDRTGFGGTYESIINKSDLKMYFDITRPENKKKRNTRIHPHILEIKRLVESKKTGNSYMRVLKPGAKVEQPPIHIFEPRVQVSGSPGRQRSKARAPAIQSISISDRVDIAVTHANPKKGAKRHKHISGV